jgi:hypothetical protein
MKQYHVYVQGILNLWALVYTTDSKEEASDVASQYNKSKVVTKKLKG